MTRSLDRAFFARSVHDVAPELVGASMLVDGVGGVIVEVEAYDHEDPAAHGYRGQTARNASMFGTAGHAYVYRSYGIHWCVNLVCDQPGVAAAVLDPGARADPRDRRDADAPRPRRPAPAVCRPGEALPALGITRQHDGLPLDEPPFELTAREGEPEILAVPRIGITQAADRPWRYVVAESRYLSRAVRPRS